jgi:hypothetical protein
LLFEKFFLFRYGKKLRFRFRNTLYIIRSWQAELTDLRHWTWQQWCLLQLRTCAAGQPWVQGGRGQINKQWSGSGSGIRCCLFCRDPEWVKNEDPDPGSEINIPDHISENLETIFWAKYTWIRDGKNLIRDKHPRTITLLTIHQNSELRVGSVLFLQFKRYYDNALPSYQIFHSDNPNPPPTSPVFLFDYLRWLSLLIEVTSLRPWWAERQRRRWGWRGPDPPTGNTVLRIRIRMFLGLQDPDLDP